MKYVLSPSTVLCYMFRLLGTPPPPPLHRNFIAIHTPQASCNPPSYQIGHTTRKIAERVKISQNKVTCTAHQRASNYHNYILRVYKQNCPNISTAYHDCNKLPKVTYNCFVYYILIM
jgi:hypothetical protein